MRVSSAAPCFASLFVLCAAFTSEDCVRWAQEGECAQNPSFMWSDCLPACVQHAKDDDERCDIWMREGECTNNPSYIQVHCPESCQFALSWSPWQRSHANLTPLDEKHPYLEAKEQFCAHPKDILQCADLQAARLLAFVNDGAGKGVTAFSTDAPSEYLGMAGMAEAFIYALRLYDASMQHTHAQLTSPGDGGYVSDYCNADTLSSSEAAVAQVSAVMGAGWDGDLIMRSVPQWVPLLRRSAQAAHNARHQRDFELTDRRLYELSCNGPPDSIVWKADFATRITSYLRARSVEPQLPRAYTTDVLPVQALLRNGVRMPLLGLGTWQLEGRDCEAAVYEALRVGYRHLDTAEAYRNEQEVGFAIARALREGFVTREELFVATKLSDETHGGYTSTREFVQSQLAALQLEYIDLYMLHSPFRDFDLQMQSWKALEDLYREGVIRSLGVSNFNTHDLRRLLAAATERPAVLQVKIDVYHFGKQLDDRGDDVVALAQQEKIAVVAYSPFSAYPLVMRPLDDPVVRYVAFQNQMTPAQVIIKWLLQQNIAVIPRSSDPQRLLENFNALRLQNQLEEADMTALSAIKHLAGSPINVY